MAFEEVELMLFELFVLVLLAVMLLFVVPAMLAVVELPVELGALADVVIFDVSTDFAADVGTIPAFLRARVFVSVIGLVVEPVLGWTEVLMVGSGWGAAPTLSVFSAEDKVIGDASATTDAGEGGAASAGTSGVEGSACSAPAGVAAATDKSCRSIGVAAALFTGA